MNVEVQVRGSWNMGEAAGFMGVCGWSLEVTSTEAGSYASSTHAYLKKTLRRTARTYLDHKPIYLFILDHAKYFDKVICSIIIYIYFSNH